MKRNKGAEKHTGLFAGTVITLTGAGLWGLNAVVSKYLMARGIDAMWMVNFRMITSGLVLLIVAAVRNPRGITDIWKDRRSAAKLLVIALLAFGVCQLTYYMSIRYSNAGIAAAIQQTAPVFVLMYVMFAERRSPYPAELISLPLVIFGSFLIATHGDPHALAVDPRALVSGLISALCCALYITMPAGLIREYGTTETVGWGRYFPEYHRRGAGLGTVPRRLFSGSVLQTMGLSRNNGRGCYGRAGIHHTAGSRDRLCFISVWNKHSRTCSRRSV